MNNFSFSLIAKIFAPLFLPIPSSESDLFSAVSKRLISLLNSNSSISHSLPASRSRKSIAIDFLDLLAGSECEIEEFELSNDISLFETAEKRSLSELGIGKKSGAKILAIKENEKLFTNPGGNFILQPGQVLIAFGSKEQLNILNGLLGNLVVAVELLK